MSELEERARRDFVSDAVTLPVTVRTTAMNSVVRRFCRRGGLINLCTASLLLVFAAGCGSGKPDWEKVFPASGTVKFGGQPIPGAMVILVPKDQDVPDKVRPTGIADSTGYFELGTYSEADGAPEGDYDVLVTWRPLVDNGGSMSPGPNRLPERYSKAETSQLSVHIDADETELKPIDLTP